MIVEIKGLCKSFGDTQAVDQVSFSFQSGEIIGFIGPNGAGKTTTMRIMSTLEQPDGGDVYYDGESTVFFPEKARRAIGYMPDSLPAHSDVTVAHYLDFFARAYGLRGPKRRQTVAEVEDFTRLGQMRDKTLNQLSKGMKQRVSLARALLNDPQVLIMDEPAAGLDPRARIELRDLMRALKGAGKSILISSHILSELEDICTSTVIIEKGRVLRSGNMQQAIRDITAGQGHLLVYVRALVEESRLREALLEMPYVEDISSGEGEELKLKVCGGDREAAELLRLLVQRQIPVVEFRRSMMNLEELFMSITKGEVS